ncbi:MAG: hypothetical protein UX43_C0004G0028 [Candidatus Giovannonibacteria bacterium GW2011_GWB1_46_20]|uniref:Lipoprotein n=1 Tax=Candidatus Giovannonibacteria bacterium GW2011_GWA1_44_25 TaxID=1618645 RepID=A0A0G1IKG1_9BACT|nr:MAG: hypothetical protein UW15_C0006G0016 [Parcubacteria group bacterium GW2011_GWC1_44_10]KKT59881.1 MAG: hypothetical protein UW53_C0006G0028 [Candidatus Giovannonibacteria bacterium GW2011_GWA1_44_25]KKU29867.1 MAG: hypothetical protein UX43_C0004G0028 [Candidatus Giovannonibacteria bacterium GW2011_GWB1_46_20]
MKKLIFAAFLSVFLSSGCEAILFNVVASKYCSGLTLEQRQKQVMCL